MTERDTPIQPETDSFEITTVKSVEVDFTEEEIQNLCEQLDADSAEGAIERLYANRSIDGVEPEEKLLTIQVEANGPSDD